MVCSSDNIGKIVNVRKVLGIIDVQKKVIGRIVDYCVIAEPIDYGFAYDLNFDL